MKKPRFFSYHRLNLPVIFLVGLVLFAGLWFFAIRAGRPKPSKDKLAAVKAALKTGREQELQKFHLTGFDEQGKKFWNLEGEVARIDPGQVVYLEKKVTLRLRNSTVITTDHVQWSQDKGFLRTDADVFVNHEGARIHGVGAVGRPNENFVQLNRRIRMVVDKPPAGSAAAGTTTIICEGPLKIFYRENKMIFYRNVKVTDERGVLTAKRMDVFFDNEKKNVSQIEAIGDVVIERGTDTTHSNRAIYTPDTGSVRLVGNPEITLHQNSQGLLDGSLRN